MSTQNTAAASAAVSGSRLKRAAFLVCPHAGGTYTVFVNLRFALAGLGIKLDWIGINTYPDYTRSAYAWEFSSGQLIDARGRSEAEQCREIVSAIEGGRYEMVFINVLTTHAEMSAAAYLPDSVARVMVVHNMTPGTYSAAKAVAPYVHAVVGVSPRIVDDLGRQLRLPQERVFCVPNAMDFSPYDKIIRSEDSATLRLLSVGRIVEPDKGVLWLPEILKKIRDMPAHLTIVGEGKDLAELRKRCATFADRVTFLDKVAPSEIPQLMAQHDVLLLPSRFEGFGYTLIEAMAAGCVPVASRIRGVTDFVVKDGETGLLFNIGDINAAAGAIRRLWEDASLRSRFARNGAVDVRARFSVQALTRAYEPVVASLQDKRVDVRRLNDPAFQMLQIGGRWRRFIPAQIKNFLRARLLK